MVSRCRGVGSAVGLLGSVFKSCGFVNQGCSRGSFSGEFGGILFRIRIFCFLRLSGGVVRRGRGFVSTFGGLYLRSVSFESSVRDSAGGVRGCGVECAGFRSLVGGSFNLGLSVGPFLWVCNGCGEFS